MWNQNMEKRMKNGWYYKDIAENIETRFDNSNYELDRSLPKGKNENSYWFNERWIRWKSHEIICWIKSKNL